MRKENDSDLHESFDFVIVGAGPSAMGLVYGLLEPLQNQKLPFTLCVLDQGGDVHESATRDPKNWYSASHSRSSKSSYQIPSIITDRVIDLPIGKGLGGTSNINATLCTPPLATELKSWPSPWKHNLFGYMKEVQSVLIKNGALQGVMASRRYQSPFPFKDKKSIDFMPGVPTLATKNNNFEYKRRNYFDGLVEPLLENIPHLKESVSFRLGSMVQRIIIDEMSSTANGLRYLCSNGKLHTIHARKEVILCAGAIESPVLLQLSGVTAGGQVGLHLKDQVLIPRIFFSTTRESRQRTTVNGIQALGHFRNGQDIFQVAILETAAIRTIVPSTVAMAVRRNCKGILFATMWRKMFEFSFLFLKELLSWILWCLPVRLFLESYTATTLLFLMHPISEGSIQIRSKDKRKQPALLMRRDVSIRVNCNYLHNKRDIETLRRAWGSIPRDHRAYEIFPRYIFRPISLLGFGWDWFPVFCWLFSQPYYHFCSSCRMKAEDTDGWVVDGNLCVHTHSKLRICDASVFPDTISSPPALTCCALGYGLAKHLLLEVTEELSPAK